MGSCMVTPSAMPRGMIVTLCTGSAWGSFTASNAWPASWKAVTFFSSSDRIMDLRSTPMSTLSLEEKKVTAFHEAGHALLAVKLPHADPVHKVTIIPRGMALGVTMQLPIDDKHNYTKEYLETEIAILMGGRLAKELFLNQMSTGAGNDIERATE